MKLLPLLLPFTLLALIRLSNGENITFFLAFSSYSHRLSLWPLAEILKDKGHDVTFVSPTVGKSDTIHPGIKEVLITDVKETMEKLRESVDVNLRYYGVQPPILPLIDLFTFLPCKYMHESEAFQKWVKKAEPIDLMIVDSSPECSYGVAKTFGAKIINFNVLSFFPKMFESFGISAEASSIPNFVGGPLKAPMSFFGRALNVIAPVFQRGYQIFMYEFFYKRVYQNAGLAVPELYDMERDTALYMTNADYMDDYPRGVPPFVVKVGGMHLGREKKKNLKLEPEVEKFVNDPQSKGFIYISFGTFVDSSRMPAGVIQHILKAIEALPHIRFVWVWRHEFTEKIPKNLLLVKWCAQPVLLGHPKIKAFVTQGGRPSLQEALHNAVPTIAFPCFCEQDYNSHHYVRLGITTVFELGQFTADDLIAAFNRHVEDDELRKRVKRLSMMGKDVQVDPIEKALWWVEFVMRHSNEELSLLKPLAQEQYWFVRRELDVWCFVFLASLGMSVGTVAILKRLYRRCLGKREKSKSSSSDTSKLKKQ